MGMGMMTLVPTQEAGTRSPFFIELSATSHPQSLKCLARAPRPKPQIAFLKFDLSDHSQIILSGYMALPYTGQL